MCIFQVCHVIVSISHYLNSYATHICNFIYCTRYMLSIILIFVIFIDQNYVQYSEVLNEMHNMYYNHFQGVDILIDSFYYLHVITNNLFEVLIYEFCYPDFALFIFSNDLLY